MLSVKTLNQKRARFALEFTRRIKMAKEGKWMEYLYDKNEFREIEISPKSLRLEDFSKKFKEEGGIWEGFKQNLISQIGEKEKFNKYFLGENLKDEEKEEIVQKYKSLEVFKCDYTKDYSSHAKRLSQMIISNGLIPAVAFYKSKGEDRRQIYNDLQIWLIHKQYLSKGDDLLDYLVKNCDFVRLRLITMEALEFANWLKRIVEIELEG